MAIASAAVTGLLPQGRNTVLARVDTALFAALVRLDREMADSSALAEGIIRSAGDVSPDVVIGSKSQTGTDHGRCPVCHRRPGRQNPPRRCRSASVNSGIASTVSFHSPAVREAARESFELEQELRHAIEAEQFTLAFQPVVDLGQGRTVGPRVWCAGSIPSAARLHNKKPGRCRAYFVRAGAPTRRWFDRVPDGHRHRPAPAVG